MMSENVLQHGSFRTDGLEDWNDETELAVQAVRDAARRGVWFADAVQVQDRAVCGRRKRLPCDRGVPQVWNRQPEAKK